MQQQVDLTKLDRQTLLDLCKSVLHLLDALNTLQSEGESDNSEQVKAGARHSRSDSKMLQEIHDHAVKLGAMCEEKSESEQVSPNNGTTIATGKAAMTEASDTAGGYTVDNEEEGEEDNGKATASFQDLPLASREMAWDESKARNALKKWAGGPDKESIDWDQYGKGFFYHDPEDKENFQAYKLPYAMPINGTLTAIPRAIFAVAGGRGVRAANIPNSDKQAIIGQVNRYYKKMAKEPDDDSIVSPFERKEKALEEGNSLKAIRQTDNELIVANYMVLFDKRDNEGVFSEQVNEDGSRGEYFTKATQFDSDYTETDTVLIDIEHGLDPDKAGIDKDTVVGKVMWSTAQEDDTGLWVERALNRRNKYIMAMENLGIFDTGLVGNSSEAVPDRVTKSADGRIEVWPLRRDTLTFSPMQPEMLFTNPLKSSQQKAAETLVKYIPELEQLCKVGDTDCHKRRLSLMRMKYELGV